MNNFIYVIILFKSMGIRESLIKETKEKLREKVNEDDFIVQTISSISEIDKVINILVKRIREWYALYNPEFERKIEDHSKFVELILVGEDEKEKDSMGAEIELEPIKNMAKEVDSLFKLREKQEEYLAKVMKAYCPNLTVVAGVLVGAKLISLAGDLKRLILFPSSTVQLLGAEKALFRHMKTGARVPKHGIIHEHAVVAKASKENKGKAARALADKISMAAKIDYFKGEFIGDKLKKELEGRFK